MFDQPNRRVADRKSFNYPLADLSAESYIHMRHPSAKCFTRTIAVLLLSAVSPAGRADAPPLCLANACLGMTVAQAGALDLQPAGIFAISFAKGTPGDGYGLGPAGERIWFMGNYFDKNSLTEFTRRVKTICAVEFVGAKMKASDGQPIRLTFRPVMRKGLGELILTQIERTLPPNLSESQMGEVVAQAKARYGVSFSREYPLFPKRSTASIRRDFAMGTSLSLVLPFENVRNVLKEQPGCSDKARLD